MKIAKWHGELDRFIDIKTAFILEGNVLDLNAYPTKTLNGEVRWDMIMLDNYLFKYLSDNGYENIVFYNHIDGFYNDFDPKMLETFCKENSCGSIDKQRKNCKVPMCQAGEIIRTSLSKKDKTTAIILMLASRFVISADNLSETERDFYTQLLCTSLKKTQVYTENGLKNNLLFLICDKANDIPVWFYLDNPLVKTLMVSEPDKESRKMFIDSQISFFPCEKGMSNEELEKFKEHFVDLTDGFKNLELNALKLLCKKEGLGLERIKDAINMYKYGLKDNPWNDIPREKLESAESTIRKRVKGQNHAVIQALDIIKRAASNMAGLQHSSGSKPKGILFFAGPTGTGKTELAKTLSELLFGDENACLRFDMSEYQQGHSDQKLLGAPPGYVGYESGGQLTNAIKEKPFSIILFDEIEKAHPSIFDKFLQILDDGRMTDGKGETVYFSESIIIFTSNLGIYKTDEYGNKVLNVSVDMPYDEMKDRIISAIKDYFKIQLGRPEILNRIGDNFVVFDFIREEVAKQILESQINKIAQNLNSTKKIALELSDESFEYLLNKSFGNIENGGRGIGNIVEKQLINPLSRYIFDNNVDEGKMVLIKKIEEDDEISKLICEVS